MSPAEAARFYRESLARAGLREFREGNIGKQILELVYHDDVDVVRVLITNLGERGTSIYAVYETNHSDRKVVLEQAREALAPAGD